MTFTFKGRKGRWGPCPAASRAGLSREGPGQREGRSEPLRGTKGNWPRCHLRPRERALEAALGRDARSLPEPGLPGHRDGGPGWVRGGESWRYRCLPGPSQGPPAQPCRPAGSSGCSRGQGSGVRGVDASPNLRGVPITSETLPVSVSLPPVTSLLGTSKCKMQKPGPTAAWRPAPAAA